ncbi:hypothetical protein FRC06_005133, partial [Ceratobasidium sp. 370]
LPVKLEPGDPPLFEPPLPGPCPTPLPPSAAIGLPASISTVKLEPDSTPLHPSSEASQSKTSAQPSLPTPVEAKVNVDPESDANRPALAHETDKVPNTVDVVIYTPENALAKVLQMADTIGSRLLQVDLGSPLRKDVWLREVESLKSQDLPGTMIAVCGATGAGKSSLLNAVLDDNIVPTSGMRACTAVVTEIRYHNKTTIAAEIEFLALSEWKAELESLLDDLVDKDGKLRRLADLRSDAGVAWHKANFQTNIHAVYPLLAAERMVEMTPDAIIAAHPDIQCILDSTRKIESPNSEAFALEIAQYVDSVDQKRSRDKGKEKSKAGNPALWPLIRLVRVCCGAGALKCGAVLVDLPGIADANLARSSIAKEYMKKCDRIWIVAPITRAVDDKAAKDLLGEAFKTQLISLKQLNQVEIDGEAKDLNSFDPSKDLRDNNTIDLPVFTCSSRDYIRIKEQVKGDGGPSCFANPEDTGIPALQQWCHELTVTTREQCARSLLNNLTTFLHSIRAHLDDMKGVSVADRTALAEMWKSSMLPSKFGDLGLTQVHPAVLASSPAAPCSPTNSRRACKRSESPSPDSSLSGIARQIEQLQDQKHMMLVGDEGKGISFRLRTSMEKVVSDCVAQLKQAFHDGIDGQCRVGAEKAKKAAVETSDTLADSMHWGTYRATLRRHGEYKRDLNAELVAPMTREIASSWTQVFESDLFTPVKSAARTEVVKLLKEIEDSAPAGLKDRCRAQAQVTLKEVQVVTANILRNIKTAMTNEQKEVSRCLTPHVKSELLDGYRLALEERGAGSVARQKEVFHDYVERNREDIFDDGANSLVDKLNQAAESVGKLLECALNELSEKVEVGMSTLWEIPKGNEDNIMKNGQLMKHICAMLEQLEPWVTASKNAMNIDIEMDTGDGVEDETDVGMDAIEKSGQPDN